MKSFKKVLFIGLLLIGLTVAVIYVFAQPATALPVLSYYDYDKALPLQVKQSPWDTLATHYQKKLVYTSVHNKQVTALLSVPKEGDGPQKTIMLLHGLGDHKQVDYIEAAHNLFIDKGYAVFRIDIANHGDRFEQDLKFDLTGPHRYWTRNMVAQTVFDLRRGVDLLEQHKEIDPNRIGFYGISLGGITGTLFSGVEPRIKASVIVIAGGQLNLLYGEDALDSEAKEFVSVIEPLNFVEAISPRPLLMLNAEEDEVILPMMSTLLYNKAKEPKKIIWYPAKHKTIPQPDVYLEGVNWYNTHL
ncbi:alpha/beta hydrolase family protein [Sediminicola luteus]|nr:acetylxylan esterase [Sediminicola luteus]